MKYSVITFFGFAFAILCFGWFIGTSDYNEVYDVFAAVELKYLVLMFVTNFFVTIGRSLRWLIILKPLGDISPWKSFKLTTIGFGSNIILPARAGEFIKPLLASREMNTSFSASFTTVVLERIFDLIVLMSILALIIFYLPSIVGTEAKVPAVFLSISRLFIFFPFIAIVLCTLAAYHPEKFLTIVTKICSYMPHWIGHRLLKISNSFVEGVESLSSPLKFLSILFVSYGIWGLNLLYYWVGGIASGFDMGIAGSAVAMTATAFAAALPQAPGYIGVFHVAMEIALKSVGIAISQAKVCAVLTWAFAALPVAIMGIAFALSEGLSLRGLANKSEHASEACSLEQENKVCELEHGCELEHDNEVTSTRSS